MFRHLSVLYKKPESDLGVRNTVTPTMWCVCVCVLGVCMGASAYAYRGQRLMLSIEFCLFVCLLSHSEPGTHSSS